MTSKAPEIFPSLHDRDLDMLKTTRDNPIQGIKTVLSDDDVSRKLRSKEACSSILINIWNGIVGEFSTTSLTKTSDKLVATPWYRLTDCKISLNMRESSVTMHQIYGRSENSLNSNYFGWC